MAIYSLIRQNPCITKKEMIKSLDGNLCRCTGYRPILEVAREFGREDCCSVTHTTEVPQNICPSTGKPCDCTNV
ncbi:MAG: 2Fe-2S iron-sulfur cluster-binding protein [Actinobacteria bacterium]|nr:2Fe-2S iron-sulfur cluster-binding protein [Actinomycetota bacterium]